MNEGSLQNYSQGERKAAAKLPLRILNDMFVVQALNIWVDRSKSNVRVVSNRH